ncbi:fumarylacetoacetate hydrolase family protein [Rhizobiaceae bacterium BDR2-2]|uniref:Fumarylacetoacetate hydrolase family protein n=1 Tax=Ectorhizobium quercum TaxID=2965071 RepID=A0AAE3N412_9HYPH|nr:fumarylacetoacetate hydrolase family protein [Ectorhizobium quercum]MCX8999801.1 fumarylacetoacetate hydrolase family protein [Ectorhizobium quercum]
MSAEQTVIPAPQPILLPVAGENRFFPVRRVYCVGQNYADHAIEMGGDPTRNPPFFFQKNPDNLLSTGEVPYPPLSEDVHHEVECVIVLKEGGAHIPIESALDHVWGYGIGIDFTRRDLQAAAKKAGRPWEAGKAFEKSAPVSPLVPAEKIGHLSAGAIWLKVNGETRQSGDLNQMIWKVPEIIAELSKLFTLAPGDVIFTGTPAGVSAVHRSDEVECGIEGLGTLSVRIV